MGLRSFCFGGFCLPAVRGVAVLWSLSVCLSNYFVTKIQLSFRAWIHLGEWGTLRAMSEDKKGNGGGTAFGGGAVIQDGRGRFRGGSELTDKQATYVTAYVANGGNRKLAAISAGYAEISREWCRLHKNPAVLLAIREEQAIAVAGMVGLALGTLKQVMSDTAAPPAARIQAAKWTLEANGFGLAADMAKNRIGAVDIRDKPLNSLSANELEEIVRMAEEQRAAAISAESAQSVEVQVSEVDEA